MLRTSKTMHLRPNGREVLGNTSSCGGGAFWKGWRPECPQPVLSGSGGLLELILVQRQRSRGLGLLTTLESLDKNFEVEKFSCVNLCPSRRNV